MPVYEYLCESCEHEFEELVFRHDEVVPCPKCGSERSRKLMSTFAVTGAARLSGRASCGSCKPSAGKCSGCGGH
jgi:putative FmdB family regulatory protein